MGFLVENELADNAVRRNAAAGGHYFDKDTLRFFGSRIHEGYDMGDGSTLVIMSNKDKGWQIGGERAAVVNGRRHYYFVVVDPKGSTHKSLTPDEYRYDVSKGTGYWLSLRGARAAAKRFQAEQATSAKP